jgi:hypothetical protein
LYLSKLLNASFESLGFLDIGCPTKKSWPYCDQNFIIPLSDVVNLTTFHDLTGIKWTEAEDNYCKFFNFPPRRNIVKFDYNMFEGYLPGRIGIHAPWALHLTHNETFSWINFVRYLGEALNKDIKYHCHRILKDLGPRVHCLHTRHDHDTPWQIEGLLEKLIEKGNFMGLKNYVVTRVPEDLTSIENVYSKFSYGNFSSNARSLMLDVCVCSSEAVTLFSGNAFSTYSMLIAAMRTATNKDLPSVLYGTTSYASSDWYNEYYGMLNITYA